MPLLTRTPFNQERRAMVVYQEMQDLDSSYSEAYCQMGQIYQKKYNELDSACTCTERLFQ